MLSDEEKKAIEDVMEMIELHKDGCLITTDDDFDNLEILLNLIEKQSKKIEEFKQALKKRIKYCNELEKDLFENCSNYIVSKDKIKAKIEEIEKRRLQDGECELALHEFQREAKLDVLQSLLKKE